MSPVVETNGRKVVNSFEFTISISYFPSLRQWLINFSWTIIIVITTNNDSGSVKMRHFPHHMIIISPILQFSVPNPIVYPAIGSFGTNVSLVRITKHSSTPPKWILALETCKSLVLFVPEHTSAYRSRHWWPDSASSGNGHPQMEMVNRSFLLSICHAPDMKRIADPSLLPGCLWPGFWTNFVWQKKPLKRLLVRQSYCYP